MKIYLTSAVESRIKILIFLLVFLLNLPCWSFTCYLTLAKDNCWQEYNVSVDVINSQTGQVMTTITVPKGKLWSRQIFSCEPSQKLMYKASFSPVFWENDEGKTYFAQNFWSLPDKINPGDSAWNVSVCYPKDFSLVPASPNSVGKCKCDFEAIPNIPPKKI